MKRYEILGPQKLNGEIKISGAKNSALKLMAASVLTDKEVVISNVPMISDVYNMKKVLDSLGIKTVIEKDNVVIKADSIKNCEAPFDLINKMRASILVLGPLLARMGSARIALPGGCKIGLRKIDYHIRGLEMMGASFKLDKGFIEASCPRLEGNSVTFDFPSVGATENIMMAAVLAKGTTAIENAAREPEIVDLANFLNSMGSKIYNAGTSTITIEGVNNLHGTKYSVMPDRIECGTFAFGAAVTGGAVVMKKTDPASMKIVLDKLSSTGATTQVSGDQIRVKGNCKIKSTNFVTLPYPGFPTDLQAPAMALMSLGDNTSIVTENVFENRFITASQLESMGARISIQNHHAVIKGVKKLKGSKIIVPDLRGGAALVIAALAAEGKSEISEIHHIERGYENFINKLKNLNLDIVIRDS